MNLQNGIPNSLLEMPVSEAVKKGSPVKDSVKDITNFINGEFVATPNWFEKRSPYDGKVIARVAAAGRPEVDAAVNAAHTALQGPWGKLAVADRVAMLYAVANEIDRRFEDFCDAEMTDIGHAHCIHHFAQQISCLWRFFGWLYYHRVTAGHCWAQLPSHQQKW